LIASPTADPEGAPAAAFLQIAFFVRKEKKKKENKQESDFAILDPQDVAVRPVKMPRGCIGPPPG
jgi:hypothetical protein